jgi:hypothetical protein
MHVQGAGIKLIAGGVVTWALLRRFRKSEPDVILSRDVTILDPLSIEL